MAFRLLQTRNKTQRTTNIFLRPDYREDSAASADSHCRAVLHAWTLDRCSLRSLQAATLTDQTVSNLALVSKCINDIPPLPWLGASLLMVVAMMMTVMETRHVISVCSNYLHYPGPHCAVSSPQPGLCLFEQSSVCCLISLNCAQRLFIF